MTQIRVFFALLAAFVVAAMQPAKAQDWRLVDADTLSTETFLILTVPLEDPQALRAIATQIETTYGVPLSAEWPLQAIAVHCLIFDASEADDVDALIVRMQADSAIRTAQRMRGFDLSEASYSDPLFPLQWSLDQMNAAEAHAISTGSGIKIGVIDSGIDRHHPDLTKRVLDVKDFVTATPVYTAEAHGTAIAGIIAAEASNAIGTVGVAPKAELLGLRACWQATGEAGACNSFSLARALNFALLNKVDVLNLSLGGPDDPLLRELIEAAIAQGIIVVAASGETDILAFPASVDGVIAAGDAQGRRVPAPMVDVVTTAPGGRHRYVSGSSVATAHVSGVVALMLAQDATLDASQIATNLAAAVTTPQTDPLLDACRALTHASCGS
ncbi:MAG: S8 family serine peptidase [Sulfitobacter sp.]